jgi:hypothetical protein
MIKIPGSLEMGLTGCPETSVRNYLYLLQNNPENGSFLPKRLSLPGIDHIPAVLINPLKTKLRPLYLKSQFVPRSKHFSSLL